MSPRRSLPAQAYLLNQLIEERDHIARLLLERAAHLPLANVHALKTKHARLVRRIERLQRKLR